MKNSTDFSHFEALDIRVGRIVSVVEGQTKKPTYKMTIDFGTEIGTRVSLGAYRNYQKDELVGKEVIAIVNFPPKQMGSEKSEVLMLGVQNEQGETVYVCPQTEVVLGEKIF